MSKSLDIGQNFELTNLKTEGHNSDIRGEDLDIYGPDESCDTQDQSVLDLEDFNKHSVEDDAHDESPKSRELQVEDEEEGEIIPASVFFPERLNILKKG